MARQRMHLPDCVSLLSDKFKRKECDCMHPPYPFSRSQALVRRRYKEGRSPRLRVVPKMQVREGETDLASSDLVFEQDAKDWVKKTLEADERTQRGRDVFG